MDLRHTYQKGISLVIALLLLVSCGENTSQRPQGSADHLSRGHAFFDQGQYRAAILEAKNAIKQAPKQPGGYLLLGSIFNALGQGQSAIDTLQQDFEDKSGEYYIILATAYSLKSKLKSGLTLLDNNPSLANTHPEQYHLLQAKLYVGLNDQANAKKALNSLLQKDNDNIEAALLLAELAIYNQEPEGNTQLDLLYQKAPTNPRVLFVKARQAYRKGDTEETENLLNETLAQLPNTDLMTPLKAETLNILSELLVRQGRSNEALVYTRLLAEAFPGASELQSQYETAILQYKEGKLEESKKTLEALLQEAPKHEPSNQLLGIINYLKGDLSAAEQSFNNNIDAETASSAAKHAFALTSMRLNNPQKVLELLGADVETTNNPDTLSLYGAAALSSTTPQKGEAALRRALKIDPTRTRIYLLLSRHHNNQVPPQLQKALKELEDGYKAAPSDPYILTALVQQHLHLNQADAAEKLIAQNLRSQPKELTTQLLAGEFYFEQQQLSKAQKHYQKAREIDATNASALVGLGKVAVKLKQWDKAVDTAQMIIKQYPDNPNGYQSLLSIYRIQGREAEGLAALDQLVTKDNRAIAAAALAIHYGKTGDFVQAHKYQQTALTLKPDDTKVQQLAIELNYGQAISLIRNKQYDQARTLILASLNQSANHPRLLSALVQTEILTKNYAEADKLIKQIKGNSLYLGTQLEGDLLSSKEQHSSALSKYQSAWSTSPNEALGGKIYRLLVNTQNKADANTFLSTWLNKLPNSVRALSIKSNQLLIKKDYNGAITALERALTIQPNSSVNLNNLAWAYAQTENPQAEQVAQKAYELAPNNATIADTYGWILHLSGKHQQAITLLQQAADLLPDNKEIQQHLEIAKKAVSP